MSQSRYPIEARSSNVKSPQAFSVPSSGNWDGNDGAWSTFVIRVGTPPQLFRVLPSVNGLETWVPIPDQCAKGQAWCGNARGVMPYNGANASPYSGSPNELQTTSLDPGLTCMTNRSPMCINCISINGKCTNGPCTGRYCCGDPAGSCSGQGCNGLNGICTGPYIGCPCVGPDYNIATNTPSSPAVLNPADASGFQPSQSSTWTDFGTQQLLDDEYLNISSNGHFGADCFGLGYEASKGLNLNRTLIAGITTEPSYMGIFGLKPANSTSSGKGPASMISQMKQQNLIPSLSYGYTAGAIYRQPPVLGSLTLGGFDSARSSIHNVSFPLAGDDSSSPVLSIKSITASGTINQDADILTESVSATIDTTLPFIWLPVSACTKFEKAFGLMWNDSKELYLINQTTHQQLVNTNPSITFSLASQAAGAMINITLPYLAFNLQASSPTFANGTNYFPLKRAFNASQYTLGRTFLQEAFMFVDYEQKDFSLSQTQFPTNSVPDLVTIDHSSAASGSNQHGNSLSHGAIAGIAIGASAVFVLLCSLAIFYWRRHRQQQRKPQVSAPTVVESPIQGKESWPSSPTDSPALANLSSPDTATIRSPFGASVEQDPEKPVGELEDPMTAVTAPSIHWPSPNRPRQELQGSDTAKELPPTPREREIERQRHIYELANSDVRSEKRKS
ncbi:hypothetical protein ACLMJK_007623 [Lecanora helva]